MDEFCFSGWLAVVKLHPALRRFRLLIFQQKNENRVAYGDLIAVAKPLFFDRYAIHYRSVAAIEILNLKAPIRQSHHAMFSRNGWVNYGYGVGWLAAKRSFSIRQWNEGILQWAGKG